MPQVWPDQRLELARRWILLGRPVPPQSAAFPDQIQRIFLQVLDPIGHDDIVFAGGSAEDRIVERQGFQHSADLNGRRWSERGEDGSACRQHLIPLRYAHHPRQATSRLAPEQREPSPRMPVRKAPGLALYQGSPLTPPTPQLQRAWL